MSIYELPDVIKRWEREELTIEQSVGQLLLHLQSLLERLNILESFHRDEIEALKSPKQPEPTEILEEETVQVACEQAASCM